MMHTLGKRKRVYTDAERARWRKSRRLRTLREQQERSRPNEISMLLRLWSRAETSNEVVR